MATFYSTGPVLMWAGPQVIAPTPYTQLPSAQARFLGTAEVSPQAEIRRQFQPAYNDLSGAVPFDLNFLGADAIFAIDLTRWDENTYAVLSNQPRGFSQSAAAGQAGRGVYTALNDMGSLQAHDGWTATIYAVFPYGFPSAAPNAAGRANGMPTGYRFHGGSLINDKLHQMGSKYRKLHLTFQFAPVFDWQAAAFNLYDHNIPADMVAVN